MPRRTVTVHLVRHGQSTWNAAGRLQGQTIHPSLTDLGRTQAGHAAAEVVARVDGPVALWSSDLVRATQTAFVIGRALRTHVLVDEALREQALAAMQGRRTRDLVPLPTPAGVDVAEVRWGGGESVREVWVRVARFMRRELPTAPAHLVLVSHGDTIRVLDAWLAGRSHRDLDWTLELANGSVTSRAVSCPTVE